MITLISYLIYKMRQFPKASKEMKAATKKEGTFFRRHIPGDEVSEDEIPALPEVQRSRLSKLNTLPNYFAVLAVVVFTSLLFKETFTEMIDSWKRTSQIDKIRGLKNKNLLKMYDLDVSRKSEALTEVIPENFKLFLREKVNVLKDQRIIILSWDNNRKLNSVHHETALNGWTAFLKRHELPFSVVSSLDDFSGDIYIVPQAKSFSKDQEAFLSSLLDQKKGVLLTGPCGVLSADGGRSDQGWCEEQLRLKFIPHDEKAPSKPTIFAERRNPGWMLPPGLLVSWLPEDESFTATSALPNDASAFEASFNGKLNKVNGVYAVRSLFRTLKEAHVGWLAIEPHGIGGKTGHELFYGESAIVDALSWLSQRPQIEVSMWKGGRTFGMVMSVDSESEIEGAHAIWKIFEETKTPGTFFVVSDQLKNDDRLTKIQSPLFDLGSHSLDHANMTARKLDAQFNNIQESRLVLEEKFGRAVKGFHPPEERFNEDTINVVTQNNFGYFVGDQRFFRMSPLFLSPSLVYVPRVFKDDILIKKNPRLASNDDVLLAMNEDLEEAKLLGGIYYFNSHSQVFGRGFYLEVLEDFLKQDFSRDLWKTTFGELAEWWSQRAALRLQIRGEKLIVKNTGDRTIDDVVIYVAGEPVSVSVPAGEKGIELPLK